MKDLSILRKAKEIKATSLCGKRFIDEYINSEHIFLEDVYNSHSYYKQIAYNQCHKFFEDAEGVSFRIISYNSQQFSVGFVVEDENFNDYLVIITRCNYYKIRKDFERYSFFERI